MHIVTKRTILSFIAKLFDSLDLLSPVMIKAKILIQELWSLKLDWDNPLPNQITNKRIMFVRELTDINLISIPRWIGSSPDHHIQIHGFCDASQQAFSAAVYLRATDVKGDTNTILILSKTKVAPLKRLTIPRFELSGALSLTKLVSHLIDILDLKGVSVFLWTDSSITLTWIHGHASKWKDFVQNRVIYIQKTIPHAKWRFVPGIENSADIATRGVSPSQLANSTLWWEGPTWLSQSSDTWPVESHSIPTFREFRRASSSSNDSNILSEFTNLGFVGKIFRPQKTIAHHSYVHESRCIVQTVNYLDISINCL